jgi:hypothetical protein
MQESTGPPWTPWTKLFAADRLGENTTSVKGEQIDAWHSAKPAKPGGNASALMEPEGFLLRRANGPRIDTRAGFQRVLSRGQL